MLIRNILPADLPELPDLSANPEEILNRMISQFEAAYLEQTGSPITLSTGNPIRIWLYTISLNQYLLENLVKYYASQNFLSYARGEYLDHISATRGGPKRRGETSAIVTMRFAFSTALTQTEVIPANTRVTAEGSGIYFAVTESHTLPASSTEWEGVFTCQTPGVVGNGFLPGQIATLVDPLVYVQSSVNIDTSQGGANVESDEQYAERVYLSPEGYSVAGPELAYEYLAKSFRPAAIMDVKAYMPEAGHVNVVPLLQGGEVPDQAFLNELLEFLSARDKRPLTDYVHTLPPEKSSFDIEFTYYITAANSEIQKSIHEAVARATQEYISWQKAKMGRDINPQFLISRVLAAGAKRLDIVSPQHTVVNPYGIAIAAEPSITYGGPEDE